MSRENKIIVTLFALFLLNLVALFYVDRQEKMSVTVTPDDETVVSPSSMQRIAGEKIVRTEKEEIEIDTKEKMKVTFLDIGQGDATYISFPTGEDMLVDCSKDTRILAALGRTMNWLDRELDYLIVTHPDMDHYGGCVDVLKRFRVKTIITNGGRKEYDEYWQYFWDTVQAEQAIYKAVAAEEIMAVGDSRVHFLYPDKPVADIPGDVETNNQSLVFKLSYKDSNMLFMADAEKELEEYLIKKYTGALDVDVLKVAHHGSQSSYFQPFIDATTPEQAIISVGAENKYGHPSLRVIRRLERAGSAVWRTDTQGDILVTLRKDGLTVTNITR